MGLPRLLIVAGSDSGGGAGIQADIKTATAFGVYAMTAITAVTVQNTLGVSGWQPIQTDVVQGQIAACLSDIGADAIKTGMLGDAAMVQTVAGALRDYDAPLVLDPVMVAKGGDALLAADAVAAVRDRLVPLAEVITPNLPEAAVLLAAPEPRDLEGMQAMARSLLRLGPASVLLKGGHLDGPEASDVYGDEAGLSVLSAPRVATKNTHGTGCTLSSAVAALLPRWPRPEAVARAKAYVTEAIRAADRLDVGSGHGPLHHGFATA